MRRTTMLLAATLAAVVGAGIVVADTVQVTVTGEVEFNQISASPLGDANPGDPATITFLVDSNNFVNSPSFPVRGYVIDPNSFTFTAGSATVGLQNPFPGGETPFFSIRNDDPAVDGFVLTTVVDSTAGVPLDQVGSFGNFRDNFYVTYTGDTLSSLDILDAVGTYDFTNLTVFNFTVDDGPFNAMGLIFEQLVIEAGGGNTVNDDFEGGTNIGGWTWNSPNESILGAGGNPDSYLDSGILDTFAPRPQSTGPSAFTGNYRAKGVTSIGIDVIQLNSATTGGRPLTLELIYDNGTPGDPFDDTAAYFLGPNIPAPGEGWVSFDYSVPSQDATLPPGWLLLNLGDSGAPANHDWDTVIQNVSQVQFFYGDPTFFFIFQQWVVGLDNVRITAAAGGVCGDGAVDPGEECDEGSGNSDEPGATCRTDCTLAGCGDAILDPGEECDDGDDNSQAPGASCREDCTLPFCGDGIVDPPDEECDRGEENSDDPNAICFTDCTLNPDITIPTVSEWGLIVMGVLFVGLGAFVFRYYLKP